MKHIHGGNFDIICPTRELCDEVIKCFVFPETRKFENSSDDWYYKENHLLVVRSGKYDGYGKYDPGMHGPEPYFKILGADDFLKLYHGVSGKIEHNNQEDLLLLL